MEKPPAYCVEKVTAGTNLCRMCNVQCLKNHVLQQCFNTDDVAAERAASLQKTCFANLKDFALEDKTMVWCIYIHCEPKKLGH